MPWAGKRAIHAARVLLSHLPRLAAACHSRVLACSDTTREAARESPCGCAPPPRPCLPRLPDLRALRLGSVNLQPAPPPREDEPPASVEAVWRPAADRDAAPSLPPIQASSQPPRDPRARAGTPCRRPCAAQGCPSCEAPSDCSPPASTYLRMLSPASRCPTALAPGRRAEGHGPGLPAGGARAAHAVRRVPQPRPAPAAAAAGPAARSHSHGRLGRARRRPAGATQAHVQHFAGMRQRKSKAYERKKERKTYARLQACVKGALNQ
jgi:hypothetical protein